MKELRAVWIEIEDPVGDGNIDRSTGEGDSLALGENQLNVRRAILAYGLTGSDEHGVTKIDADHPSTGTDPPRSHEGVEAGAAPQIQHRLTGVDIRGDRQV
jgi:hypothetical protein